MLGIVASTSSEETLNPKLGSLRELSSPVSASLRSKVSQMPGQVVSKWKLGRYRRA